MVAITTQRMIISPSSRSIVSSTDDHPRASAHRAPAQSKKMRELLQKQNCGGRGEVTPLLLHVGRVVEGVLTRGTARFIGHGFRRSRRANERPAPARALQGGDVGPFVQADQPHFHTRLSLTSAVPRRRCAEVARPNILGAPAGGRRMGTCRDPRCGDHRPDKSVSPGRRAGWSRTGLRPKECSEGNTLGVRKQGGSCS
jgi:hypothetical protein